MKTLELELKKKVLIVDLEDDKAGFINGNYDFLCDGSDLTEEIASELVKTTWIHDKKILCKYKNYNSEGDGSYFSAVKSFISAVESKGFNWLKHNIKPFSLYDPRSKTGCHDLEEEEIVKKQWQEAEEKTFKNPLIFVKK